MTTNNTLTRYETSDGIELVIDQQTGEAFVTERGYSCLPGLSARVVRLRISRIFQGGNTEGLQIVETRTPDGLQVGAILIPADIVFDWLSEDNPTIAEEMSRVGATNYIHRAAGLN